MVRAPAAQVGCPGFDPHWLKCLTCLDSSILLLSNMLYAYCCPRYLKLVF